MLKFEIRRFFLFSSVLMFCLVLMSMANTFYVAPDGKNTNPGTLEEPWRDISFATCGGTYKCPCTDKNPDLIQAGDTLLLRQGIYRDSGIHVTNSGTLKDPIIIRSYPGEMATIDGEYQGDVISLGLKNELEHVHLDSITVIKGRRSGIAVGLGRMTKHISIKNCVVTDIEISDNTACVFVGTAHDDTRISGCKLSTSRPNATRGAGVEIFRGANNIIIEYCEIFSSHKGIYYKHGNNDVTNTPIIRGNYIHDISHRAIALSTDNTIIDNNLLVRTPGIVVFNGVSGACEWMGSFNTVITHNTLVGGTIELNGSTECSDRGSRYTEVENNIIYNTDDSRVLEIWKYTPLDSVGHQTSSDYNLYYSQSIDIFRIGDDTYNLGAFQHASKLDSNSIKAIPVFRDTAKLDYRLKNDSPGKNAASDGQDMGVLPEYLLRIISRRSTGDFPTALRKFPSPLGEEIGDLPGAGSGSEKTDGCGSGLGLAFMLPFVMRLTNRIKSAAG